MPTLDEYMARYDHEHTSPWNKALHAVGIPIIFAGAILLILTHWRLGPGTVCRRMGHAVPWAPH